MKPFDLVAALEGAPVVLRNGCKAYVLADTDNLGEFESIYCNEYPLVVIYAGGGINMHMRDGSYYKKEPDNCKDIIGMWEEPPRTITVGRHTFPAPLNTTPKDGEKYWYVDYTGDVTYSYWYDTSHDADRVSSGRTYHTKQAAEAAAAALGCISKGDF